MSGSSHSSCVLPLLLLSLLLCLSASSSASTSQSKRSRCKLHEFQTDIKSLEEDVKKLNCPQNCSMGHITESACRCLNLSMSAGERVFPNYFSKGLKSLNLPTQKWIIENLNKTLIQWSNATETISVEVEPLITPLRFCEKLQKMVKQMQSIRSVICRRR